MYFEGGAQIKDTRHICRAHKNVNTFRRPYRHDLFIHLHPPATILIFILFDALVKSGLMDAKLRGTTVRLLDF